MKKLIRHYRRYDGGIACGTKGNIEATSAEKGVNCKKCLEILRWNKEPSQEARNE